MRLLHGLRYTYYCADRRWRKMGIQGSPSTDYLMFAIVGVWMFDVAFFLICLHGGPSAPPPKWAKKFVFMCVSVGICVPLSLWWSLKRERIVAAMYREFEPKGLAQPIKVGLVARTVLLPVVLFIALVAILLGQQHHHI